MSILYPDDRAALPRTLEIEGVVHVIRWQYYIALEIIKLLEASPRNMPAALDLFYADGVPADTRAAVAGLSAYMAGAVWSNGSKGGKAEVELLNWEIDAPFIWASLKQTYPGWEWASPDNPAHWYEFRAAFDALPATAKIIEVMRIRGMEIDDKASPEQRQRIERLKAAYSLTPLLYGAEKTGAELEAEYLEIARKQVEEHGRRS